MIGTKMLGSSTEHSWAADKERVSQQVEQCVRDLKNIVRDVKQQDNRSDYLQFVFRAHDTKISSLPIQDLMTDVIADVYELGG